MKVKLFLILILVAANTTLYSCSSEKSVHNKDSKLTNKHNLHETKASNVTVLGTISKVFPDPQLSKIVAAALKKKVSDTVTMEELSNYKGELDCPPGELSDLTGIGYLTGLTKLNCCKNNVKVIPAEIKNLVNLESLDFGKAFAVESIPPEIGYLKNLKYMRFTLTSVDSIPKEIGNLKNLKILILGANKIQSLPNEIGDLEKLQCLDLNSNCLSSIPDDICKLTDLRDLDISHNSIKELPDNLGNLTKLETLNIFENNVKTLPKSMENLAYLDSMDVFNNYELNEVYKSFMPSLKSFDLKILQNSDCPIELPVDFNSTDMICEFKSEHGYDSYTDYNKIPLQKSENRKITLDKSLFTKKGMYEFRITQKNSNHKPLYSVFAWHINVE